MFSAALSHVQRNYVALLIYAAITAGFIAIGTAVETWVLTDHSLEDSDGLGKLYIVLNSLTLAAILAIAQTIAFTRMATEIERPVWKASSIPGSFMRFWSFWFTLDLIQFSMFVVIAVFPMEPSGAQSLFTLWLCGRSILVPFGAATMFLGNTTRVEMRLAGVILVAQLPYVALICFIRFFVDVTLISMESGLPVFATPALQIIHSYVACFAFAYTWEICRKHREEEENMDDLDF